MFAVQVQAPGQVAIVERRAPKPGPGEVLVNIRTGGLCGTDLHIYAGHLGSLPQIPGHDVAGVIAEVGPGVPHTRCGQRVVIDPAACCTRAAVETQHCSACRRGATHLCQFRTYMGMSAPGAFAEKVVVPATRAVSLPDCLDDFTATVLEPVAVGLHLLEQISDRPGPAWIIGGGPVGLVAAQLLAREGRSVQLSEPLAGRRKIANAWGLSSIDPHNLDDFPWAEAQDFPVVIETSGHPSALDTLKRVIKPGATVVLVGGPVEIPGLMILNLELEIRAVKGGRGLYPEAIRLVENQAVNPGELNSHRFPLTQIAQAFALASERGPQVIRVALDFS